MFGRADVGLSARAQQQLLVLLLPPEGAETADAENRVDEYRERDGRDSDLVEGPLDESPEEFADRDTLYVHVQENCECCCCDEDPTVTADPSYEIPHDFLPESRNWCSCRLAERNIVSQIDKIVNN